MQILETGRISLEEVSLEDSDFIIELLNSPGWLEFIGDAKIRTTEDAIDYIKTRLHQSYNENGFGLYKVVNKSTKHPMGLCGLIKRSFLDDVDIGFAILPQYTAKGYTYEIAQATINHALAQLGISKILAFTSLDNIASKKLLQKLGFSSEGIIKYGDTDEDVELFSLTLNPMNKIGTVKSVNKSSTYSFSKEVVPEITLLKGLGIEGDIHMGKTVKHRSRVRRDPSQPNLRQVHLIHTELFEELKAKGFTVECGQIGENITTSGVDLLNLPKGTVLKIGEEAEVEVTGLRNPCVQLDNFQPGLLKELVDKDENGNIIRKSGIMGIVKAGGVVKQGDNIEVCLPPKPHIKLEKV